MTHIAERGKFALSLTKLRKEKNFSQAQLAEAIGVSRGLIGNYEQGTRHPDFELLCQFAEFFRVSTDYLLGRNQDSAITRPTTDIKTSDQHELLQLYNRLTPINKGRALERIRILAESEIHERNKENKISG